MSRIQSDWTSDCKGLKGNFGLVSDKFTLNCSWLTNRKGLYVYFGVVFDLVRFIRIKLQVDVRMSLEFIRIGRTD